MRQIIAKAIRRVAAISGVIEGYEHPELVDSIFTKTLSYEPTDPWPLMEGISSVLDFGGACGQHYKHARITSPSIRWAVVETPAMVARASELSTENLKFFDTIPSAIEWLGVPHMVFASGAVQCTPSPEDSARELCSIGAPIIRYERLVFSSGSRIEHDQLSLLGENGPSFQKSFSGKAVKIKRVLVPRDGFVACHTGGYRLTSEGDDWMQFSKL